MCFGASTTLCTDVFRPPPARLVCSQPDKNRLKYNCRSLPQISVPSQICILKFFCDEIFMLTSKQKTQSHTQSTLRPLAREYDEFGGAAGFAAQAVVGDDERGARH